LVVQLTALTGALHPALWRYTLSPSFVPVLLGAVVAFLLLEAPGERLRAWPRALAGAQRAVRLGVGAVVLAVAGYAALDLAFELTRSWMGSVVVSVTAADDVTLALAVGAVLVELLAGPAREGIALPVLALVLAWSSAISVGWPYPSAMAGPL